MGRRKLRYLLRQSPPLLARGEQEAALCTTVGVAASGGTVSCSTGSALEPLMVPARGVQLSALLAAGLKHAAFCTGHAGGSAGQTLAADC